jgi:hypothetical protein
MREKHLYLSLIPQALIASMLTPEEFGSYYAVGTKVHVRGEAMFFELDPSYRGGDFPYHLIEERCVEKADGSPKRSVYLAIYQVLSQIPVSALGHLYLVTVDGRTLQLERAEYRPETASRLHLYQEFCPTGPMVASRLEPLQFCRAVTDRSKPVSVPRIVFSELKLGELATDPENGSARDLPYPSIDHLRDVLISLGANPDKPSRLVLKQVKHGVIYRTVSGGFYVGDQDDFAFYRFPAEAELETTHYRWWCSAQMHSID